MDQEKRRDTATRTEVRANYYEVQKTTAKELAGFKRPSGEPVGGIEVFRYRLTMGEKGMDTTIVTICRVHPNKMGLLPRNGNFLTFFK
ncbi:MAG: hypothetical protein GY820_31730 [Gammaproteobacteria bacterium]|nr:hypothetical protein [Gammaproteobacteria bacterium]